MDRQYYMGIDPGQKGAIAFINLNTNNIGIFDMPLLPDKKGIDVNQFYYNIDGNSSVFIVLEKAQAMPKQGVTGVFNYGVGYGKLLAAIEILGLPYCEVRPQMWKKEFSLKRDKKQSVNMAGKLFPQIKDQLITPRGALKDGRAEALLLAEYGRRRNL